MDLFFIVIFYNKYYIIIIQEFVKRIFKNLFNRIIINITCCFFAVTDLSLVSYKLRNNGDKKI
jgi:hypothetical protein